MTDPPDSHASEQPDTKRSAPPRSAGAENASGYGYPTTPDTDAVGAVRLLWSFPYPPTLADVFSTAVLESDGPAGAGPGGGTGGSLLADVLAEDIEQRRKRSLPCGANVYAPLWEQIVRSGPARRAVLAGEFLDPGHREQASAGGCGAENTGKTVEQVRRELVTRYPMLQADIDAVATIASVLQGDDLLGEVTQHAGDRLGKYRLDALLGTGSFGRTWLAWDEALRRHVALKILRPSHSRDTVASHRRVLAEASAAAGLDHPAIVRVHEAGQFSDSGESYIDAQFVGQVLPRGEAGTFAGVAQTAEDLVQSGPLACATAARLVWQVAGAVAAAHARGITHRDIKPSNILLTPTGEPLLADFGLASLDAPVSQADSGAGLPPNRPRIAGTPAYLAPEAARGEPATPLSDIFSLGCTLRALLAGTAPRAARGSPSPAGADCAAESLGEMLTRLGSQPLPSLAGTATNIPATLARITDRATAHDPANRYTSADRFAADLQAFLEHRPVEADPAGPIGLVSLWTRRHRTGVLITTAMLLLVGSATVAFVQGLRAERNRALQAERTADASRDEALAASETIMLMNRFLARTFNSTRGQRGSAEFTVGDAIRLGVARVSRTYGDRPLAAAAVQHFLGQAATGAGFFDTARGQLQAALDTRRLLLGPAHPDTISTLRQWATLLGESGPRAESDAAFAEVVRLLGEDAAMQNPDGLFALARLAAAALNRGEIIEARRVLEAVDHAYFARPNDGSADQQQVMNHLVTLYGKIREPLLAVAMQQRIVELNSRLLGQDDISTLNALQALASVLRSAGRVDEARAIYRDALSRYVRTVGEGHGYTMHVRLELASMALPTNPAQALALLDAVEPHALRLAPGHINRLKLGLLRGQALDAAGRSEEAVAALRPALDSAIKSVGPANRWTRSTAALLATILDRTGQSDEAAATRRSVEQKPATDPPD